MNEITLNVFEKWAVNFDFDLTKSPAMRTENPYQNPTTWKLYEAFVAGMISNLTRSK